jgi:hypothetical protein
VRHTSCYSPSARLGKDFLRDLDRDYREHGAAAIAKLRKNQPWNYFRLLSFFAADGSQTGQSWLEGLTNEELNALIKFVRAELAKFEPAEDVVPAGT